MVDEKENAMIDKKFLDEMHKVARKATKLMESATLKEQEKIRFAAMIYSTAFFGHDNDVAAVFFEVGYWHAKVEAEIDKGAKGASALDH